MARLVPWLVMAVLLAGSTGESFAGIVLVENDSYLMVPGDGAVLFDDLDPTHFNVQIPSNTFAADPNATEFGAQISALYQVGPPPVGILANAGQNFSVQSYSIVASGVAQGDSDYLGHVGTTPFEAHSVLDMTFQVTAQSWFVLSGTHVDVVGGVENPSASIRSLTSLLGPSPILIDQEKPFEFFIAGVLVPGVDYRLLFSSSEVPLTGVDHTNWGFTLTVPEPALPLQLAALLTLGLMRRRAR
jgi:hypothetical protein